MVVNHLINEEESEQESDNNQQDFQPEALPLNDQDLKAAAEDEENNGDD